MKALILNSGMGKRMGCETEQHPKCMTKIEDNETILSRQLKMLDKHGVKDIIITTGYLQGVLIDYVNSLDTGLNIRFVDNEKYESTNYIYSIYMAREYLKDDDILMIHGDLVFDDYSLSSCLDNQKSCVTVDRSIPLPQKDFKGVIDKESGQIKAVGIEFFDDSVALQPLYKLKKDDWNVWLNKIEDFCQEGIVNCYAENAFNEISEQCDVRPCDVSGRLCCEVDTLEDLDNVKQKLRV